MALTSPGVQVSVIDESFYTPAEPGTRPLVIVASSGNKTNASGTGIAQGTLKANAGKVFTVTSQRELADLFGDPTFRVDNNNNPIHGGELNEYGLQAAYSFLGVANSVLVARADIDLNELTPSPFAPGGEPQDGTYWLDTATTSWGIFEWNAAPASTRGGQSFLVKNPLVVLTADDLTVDGPKSSVGRIGDYAAATGTGNDSHIVSFFYKNRENAWAVVGSQEWTASHPTVVFKSYGGAVPENSTLFINSSPVEISAATTMTDVADAITDSGIGDQVSQTFTVVSVPNPDPGGSGAVYEINGDDRPELNLVRGGVYTFVQSDASNATHQIAFKDGLGNSYTQGVVTTGPVGQAGAQTVFTVPIDAPTSLRYYCVTHGDGMGNTISVADNPGAGQISATYTANTGVLEIFSKGVSITISGSVLGLGSGLLTAGTYNAPAMNIARHTQVPQFKTRDATPRPTGSVWIKTTEPNQGARWRLKRYNSSTKLFETVDGPIYPSSEAALADLDRTGGGINLPLNVAYVQSNYNERSPAKAKFRVMRRSRVGATVIRTVDLASNPAPSGTYTFQMSESLAGYAGITAQGDIVPGRLITVTFTGSGQADAETLTDAISAAGFTNIIARVEGTRVVISHTQGGEIRFADEFDGVAFVGGILQFDKNSNVYAAPDADGSHEFIASNWIPLTITPDTANAVLQSYYISNDDPQTLVTDEQLWFSSVVDEVDLMVHNGTTWVGYRTFEHGGPSTAGETDAFGPIVSASEPISRPDGENSFADGDIWIDTSDLENYPAINRYNDELKRWILIDKSDQTTENGVLFADARWNTNGLTENPASIVELLSSSFLDFDAPDPALFPRGMLLWNLRRSGFNVKKFYKNYINPQDDNIRFAGQKMENYYPHRWVTESANQADGSGSFGRKAQRKVIQIALQSLVNSNQEIRDTERNNFSLLACPGWPELIGELISLNFDRGLTSFIVGDTPVRLRPDATTLNNWGTNLKLALEDNDDGLVSFDEFLGVFYPWGFTSDNAGRDVVVPPSHMIMRMIALSDNVSFPWFAPAGTRRGGITNATAVGFLRDDGEFVSVALNEGQRDTLYNINVNPITFFVGSGLVNFGQKTRARNASSLDRINVARLVIYLRSQLNKLAKPYIFEPNDKITRDEIKQQVESLLLELVGQRALYDFLVVCDESNNTPNRIDRNELYVDIAIEPVKAVEFIYIPVRLKNTGEISGL